MPFQRLLKLDDRVNMGYPLGGFHRQDCFQRMLNMLRNLKSERIEYAAIDALRACLEEIPFARLTDVREQPGPSGPDLLARVDLSGAEQGLVIEVKRSGQPRLIREAINSLRRYMPEYPDAYGVVVAPYVSERSAAICEEEGIGFLDLAGNCRLCFQRVYIRKGGNENPFGEKRELRTLFSPKASRILRVLLTTPQRAWKVQELAQEADVSVGQVSNVKKLLDDREWIRTGADGLRLIQPGELLAEWATNQRYRRDKSHSCYSIRSGIEFEQQLAQTCNHRGIRYALTGFSAAARWAPMVRTPRMAAYVDGDVLEIMQELQIKEVGSGSNLRLIVPGDKGVFYAAQTVDDIVLVSPVQVYLDLKRASGRSDEAAEAILKEVIKPLW